jgi:hypothetical protein
MKPKILNFLLILFSLIPYLEWGKYNNSYLYKAELEIFTKLFTDPMSVIHPFTLLPMLGQVLLLVTLLNKQVNKNLTYIGITGIGLLVSLIFFIGIITLSFKIIIFSLPFLIISFYTIKFHRSNTN